MGAAAALLQVMPAGMHRHAPHMGALPCLGSPSCMSAACAPLRAGQLAPQLQPPQLAGLETALVVDPIWAASGSLSALPAWQDAASLRAPAAGEGMQVVHLLLPLLTQPPLPDTPPAIEPALPAVALGALRPAAQLQPDTRLFPQLLPTHSSLAQAAFDHDHGATAPWAASAAATPVQPAAGAATDPPGMLHTLGEGLARQQQYELRRVQYEAEQRQYEQRRVQYEAEHPACPLAVAQWLQARAPQATQPMQLQPVLQRMQPPPQPVLGQAWQWPRRQPAGSGTEQASAAEREVLPLSILLPGAEGLPPSPFSGAAAMEPLPRPAEAAGLPHDAMPAAACFRASWQPAGAQLSLCSALGSPAPLAPALSAGLSLLPSGLSVGLSQPAMAGTAFGTDLVSVFPAWLAQS